MIYVKGYDTVRAFAVLLVILTHWGPFFPVGSIPAIFMKVFIPNGSFGVNLFFVLSGFLITSVLLNERKRNILQDKMHVIKNFFARRSLRIFPIYYLMIFLLLLMNHTYAREHSGYFLLYASNLLPYKYNTVNPLIHTWSLAVEEQFYLIWPWFIIFVKEKYLKYVFILSILIGIVSKIIVMIVLNHHFTTLVFNCFDAFGLGGLYAYVRLNDTRCAQFERVYIVLLSFLLFIGWRMFPYSGLPINVIYIRTLDSFISLSIIMFVTKNKNEWLRKNLFENKVLNYLGKISYGIYLYHYILGTWCDWYIDYWSKTYASFPKIISNFYVSYCIKLTLLLIICALSFRFIEQPILRLKRKFEYR